MLNIPSFYIKETSLARGQRATSLSTLAFFLWGLRGVKLVLVVLVVILTQVTICAFLIERAIENQTTILKSEIKYQVERQAIKTEFTKLTTDFDDKLKKSKNYPS
jgi:hypothetical protein